MRGSSSDRSGDFKVGHKKRGGRQKGTRNHYSADLKRSLLEAASRIGSDGKGKDGLRGYLIWVAMYYPEAYLQAGVGFSAVFMAAADLLVAARSLGLGAAFTFTHMLAGPDLPKLLELPDDVAITVTIPVGWPAHQVGPVARRPHGQVLHWDKFGS